MTNISTLLQQTIADIAAGSSVTDVVRRGQRIQAHGRIVRSVLEATRRLTSGEVEACADEIQEQAMRAGVV